MAQPELPDALRSRLARAAWKLGMAHGPAAIRVPAIAHELGVSAALLYPHFEGEAALTEELQRFGAPLLAAALAVATRKATRDSMLFSMCLAYVEFVHAHEYVYGKHVGHGEPPHCTVFVARAVALLGGDERSHGNFARHLWVGVHGVALATLPTSREPLAEVDDRFIHEHLRLLLRALGVNDLATAAHAPAIARSA